MPIAGFPINIASARLVPAVGVAGQDADGTVGKACIPESVDRILRGSVVVIETREKNSHGSLFLLVDVALVVDADRPRDRHEDRRRAVPAAGKRVS